jgi:hypothetical protein
LSNHGNCGTCDSTSNFTQAAGHWLCSNYEKYLARTKRRFESGRLEKSLPLGFPQKLNSDLVWEGKDIAEIYDWVYELIPDEIEEIEQGLQHFKGQ